MEDKPSDPDVKPFPKEGKPVVFMFQPTHYKVVSPDKLQEWERDLVEKVGLKGFKREKTAQGLVCYSWSGGPIFDDSDWLQ